ncbi:hypothetical protein SAMN04488082_11088 [Desulfomicrobium apsheronum]|uniref:Uncharacterized protein n=1 Tax=Desulfomicrobium apsheronum TaxID=52560 RepID=A0A1I3VM30_9BACT|nr:hypothetical protein [Desulfomicrobium apsheronum]SFJ95386.1 hypothetical protein SAMN04488082_11088 [Desulfomicrobium apsheronum]
MQKNRLFNLCFDNKHIVFYCGASQDDIRQLVELDRIVYEEEHLVPLSRIQSWNDKNNKIYCVAKEIESNKIIAYIGLFPLKERTFMDALRIDFDETKITPDDIDCYEKSNMYYLYINSVVVAPEYKSNFLIYKNIFACFFEFVVDLTEDDIFISDACGRATSEEGIKQCKSFLRMQEVASDDESGLRIFHAKLFPVSMRLPFDVGKKIHKLYTEKHACMA